MIYFPSLRMPGVSSVGAGFVDLSKKVGHAVQVVATVAKNTFHNTCHTLAELPSDMGRLASVVRKLEKFVLPLFNVVSERFGWLKPLAVLKNLKESCNDLADVVELARIIVPVNYFFNQRFEEDSEDQIAGETCGLVADIAGVGLFLDEIKLVNLGKIAEKVGSLRYFGAITKIPLAKVGLGAATLAHAFFALDAYKEIGDATIKLRATIEDADILATVNKKRAAERISKKVSQVDAANVNDLSVQEVIQARASIAAERKTDLVGKRLKFASNVAELAVDAATIAGVTSIPGLALAGGTCIALNLATMFHKKK